MIVLDGLTPGAYTVQEVKPRDGYVGDDTVHTVYLEENRTATIELSNLRKPNLFIRKMDSITGSPIQGVKFQVWRASDNTRTGEYNDLGVFYTDADGLIHLERVDTGWYKIQELEPGASVVEEISAADGYSITNFTETVYLADDGEQSVITVVFVRFVP